jgi:hypothetical protein
MEEQLRQEQGAHQQAEAQLQQVRTILAEAQAALERECMAREQAQGLHQQERAALEKAQATLKVWDDEVMRLNRELNQLSVSYEDQRQAGEEKVVMILNLQQEAETTHMTLKTEKKQVEGELPFLPFACRPGLFGIRSQFCFLFLVSRPAGDSRELSDPGAGHLDGLQLLAVGTGTAAGCRARGVSADRGG